MPVESSYCLISSHLCSCSTDSAVLFVVQQNPRLCKLWKATAANSLQIGRLLLVLPGHHLSSRKWNVHLVKTTREANKMMDSILFVAKAQQGPIKTQVSRLTSTGTLRKHCTALNWWKKVNTAEWCHYDHIWIRLGSFPQRTLSSVEHTAYDVNISLTYFS